MSQHFAPGRGPRTLAPVPGSVAAMTVSMPTTLATVALSATGRSESDLVCGCCCWAASAVAFPTISWSGAGGLRLKGPYVAVRSRFRHSHPARLCTERTGCASGIFGEGRGAGPGDRPEHRWRAGRLVRLALGIFMVAPFCVVSMWFASQFVPTTAPGGALPPTAAARRWTGLASG